MTVMQDKIAELRRRPLPHAIVARTVTGPVAVSHRCDQTLMQPV